ncbi:hypothetical protein TW95_gp0470 [Pandoravirus inopinatum]|uniref:Uncharacterized protein n=1 Tax=Pandoravirus inopinatum TaxID=1605721 RepID=A0A0B5J176_9VIRU|nr:hypothetical protein TW95_gp0470 [Pandoravirus inopinatum]AJF97204.1 hypothetical protein [Pandoravirus inopinatum]
MVILDDDTAVGARRVVAGLVDDAGLGRTGAAAAAGRRKARKHARTEGVVQARSARAIVCGTASPRAAPCTPTALAAGPCATGRMPAGTGPKRLIRVAGDVAITGAGTARLDVTYLDAFLGRGQAVVVGTTGRVAAAGDGSNGRRGLAAAGTALTAVALNGRRCTATAASISRCIEKHGAAGCHDGDRRGATIA